MKVYLAGKITEFERNWRSQIVSDDVGTYEMPDGRPLEGSSWRLPDIRFVAAFWTEAAGAFGTTITGPFFIEGEGHDGMHSPNNHGFGDTDGNAGNFENLSLHRRRAVSRLCRGAINDADVVFAWIDDATAYGTLWELGYAHALGKPVVIAMPPHTPALDGDYENGKCICYQCEQWFAREHATHVINAESPRDGYEQMVDLVAVPEFGSPVEKQFWDAARPVFGTALKSQHGVGQYRLDFAIPQYNVGIEVDGLAYHNGQESFIADRKRQRFIEANGWRVVRFAAKEVMSDAHSCVQEVRRIIDQAAAS